MKPAKPPDQSSLRHLMDFAQQQLALYGWKDGKGLGKNEDGINSALKVEQKADNKGLGTKANEEKRFNFAWWDHAFNKAASNIVIEADSDDEGEIIVKKKRHVNKAQDFVKVKEERGSFVDEKFKGKLSDSEDFTIKISDKELLKRCEGRTGDKRKRLLVDAKQKKEKRSKNKKKRKTAEE